MNQPDFAALAGTTKKSQITYEKGVMPDAAYLASIAAAGADVRYIITGNRNGPAPETLSSDERYLLDRYRRSPQELKDAALRVLIDGEAPSKKGQRYTVQQTIQGNVGQQASGDIVNKAKK